MKGAGEKAHRVLRRRPYHAKSREMQVVEIVMYSSRMLCQLLRT